MSFTDWACPLRIPFIVPTFGFGSHPTRKRSFALACSPMACLYRTSCRFGSTPPPTRQGDVIRLMKSGGVSSIPCSVNSHEWRPRSSRSCLGCRQRRNVVDTLLPIDRMICSINRTYGPCSDWHEGCNRWRLFLIGRIDDD